MSELMEWRPIETAPTNKRFLIFGYKEDIKSNKRYYRTEIAFHTDANRIVFDDSENYYPQCYNDETQESYLTEGLWIEAYSYNGHSDNIYIKVDFNVTHWMPLPNNRISE